MSATLRDLLDALDQTDPDDLPAIKAVLTRAFFAGYRGFHRAACAHSPAFAAMWSDMSSRGGLTTATQRFRRCLDCPMVCSPGSMAMHLRYSGHSGWEEVR